VYATCTSPASVAVADLDAKADGQLESDVLSAKGRARWGRVDWQAAVPDEARVSLRFRSGSSKDPKDKSWSAWSAPVDNPGRDRARAAPGQFLQYELTMGKAAGAKTPVLDWVRVSYLPANQRPTVKEPKPKEGEAIGGKVKLKWKMADPDKDKVRARVLVRPRGKRDFKIVKEQITKSEYEWDTKSQEDGVYDMRIVVDDGLSNPSNAEEARLDIANVGIDNTAPEVGIISGPAQQADGSFALTAFALDATCIIDNIAWQPTTGAKKDNEAWRAVRLDDGLYDWRYERFLIVTGPLKESITEIAIRARDAAGNVVDKTVKLPKKEKERAEEEQTTGEVVTPPKMGK